MIVYRYGALKPTDGFDGLCQQLRLANRYRNALIELHRWRRVAEAHGEPRERTKQLWSEMSRWLRARCGLGWGTYQAIEDDVKRAIKSEKCILVYRIEDRVPEFRGSSLVRFKRFDGTGRVAATVQACSMITTDRIVAGTSPVRLSATSGRATATLRLHDSVTVTVPVLVHRELPPGAHVVRVILTVSRTGNRYVYSVNLTMRHAAPAREFGARHVAINFGWRRVNGGVRVAYAVDTDGVHTELVLPDSLIGKFRHAESLRGLADSVAASYLGDARKRTKARREALRSATNRELGFIPVEGEPLSAEHWARRDRHLYQWERDEYAKCLRVRQDIYHQWCRAIAAVYGSVTIEDFSLSELVKREGSDCDIPEARHIRFLVAPGYLRTEVQSVFGDRCQKLKKAKRTAICSVCSNECVFDRAKKRKHVCERCRAEWDQDANNAANQLADVAA
jgi:hypothetical protein